MRDIVVRLVEFVLEDVVVLDLLGRLAGLLEEFFVDLLDHYLGFVQFCLELLFLVYEVVLLELILHKEGMICLVQQQLVLVFLADFDPCAFDFGVNRPRTFSLQPSPLLLHFLLPQSLLIHDPEVAVVDEEVMALQELVSLVAE